MQVRRVKESQGLQSAIGPKTYYSTNLKNTDKQKVRWLKHSCQHVTLCQILMAKFTQKAKEHIL